MGARAKRGEEGVHGGGQGEDSWLRCQSQVARRTTVGLRGEDGVLASGHQPTNSSKIEVLGCLSEKGPEGCIARSWGRRGSCQATQRRAGDHTRGSVWEEWGLPVTLLQLPSLEEGVL